MQNTTHYIIGKIGLAGYLEGKGLLEEGPIKHKIEECQKFERTEVRIEEVMKDQSDQKVEKWLREVERTGKKCSKRKR